MSTHSLSLINGWIWSNWGSGGPNPCGDSVRIRKRVLIFLALLTDGFGAIGVWGPKSMWRQC